MSDLLILTMNYLSHGLVIHMIINGIVFALIIPSMTNKITQMVVDNDHVRLIEPFVLLVLMELISGIQKIFFIQKYQLDLQRKIHTGIEDYICKKISALPWNLTRTVLSNADLGKSKNIIVYSTLSLIDILTYQSSHLFAFIGYTLWILFNSPITLTIYILLIPIIVFQIKYKNITNPSVYNKIWETYRNLASNQFMDIIHSRGPEIHDKMIKTINEYEETRSTNTLNDNKYVESINLAITLLTRFNLLIVLLIDPNISSFMIQLQFGTIIKNTSNLFCSSYRKYQDLRKEQLNIDNVLPTIESPIIKQINDFESICINKLVYEYSKTEFKLELKSPIELFRSQIVLLEGKSGSGKSSFMDIIAGVIPCNQYQFDIKIDDTVTNGGFQTLNKKRIYIEQFATSNWNIMAKDFITGHYRFSKIIMEHSLTMANCKDFVTIEEVSSTNCSKLSGGQKGRIEIARMIYAIIMDRPSILILDEIDKSLQTDLAVSIIESVIKICRSNRILCIMSAHNNEVKKLNFDMIIPMNNGIIG